MGHLSAAGRGSGVVTFLYGSLSNFHDFVFDVIGLHLIVHIPCVQLVHVALSSTARFTTEFCLYY